MSLPYAPHTPYAEVIGDPIAQSKSPLIHRFWLERLGIEGDYRHCHVKAGELADYIAHRRGDPDWRGCNVTMPHKQAVMPLLDRIDPVASAIGAVNTVVREDDGSLAGYNTDAPGFLEPLLEELKQPHLFRMARIVGNGGAARAMVRALADHGFVIVMFGRDPARGRALLDDLDPEGEHHTAPLDTLAAPTDFAFDDRVGCLDLVVNASPLGMTGNPPLAIHPSHIPPRSICYEIVTSPRETEFLKTAQQAGFRTIDGFAMLIGQAAYAFGKFFGQPAPRADDDELRALLTA
ncbi:shikimate dehydrogenase family protein [Croceicoccus marinus]|jgi:shikimate dehydrogenase|uniref:Shikimate dehydrogenase (NADP(+)) n=1 Tax=Croceicoccus marinus TaxID=450378 RepID=A0A7G6VV04_9SPHN|nr:shikimate dehydrogenase [Croceicoccus marinus]QNE05569.1 shikimate dehydrogenase [Croceicoccus marinus]